MLDHNGSGRIEAGTAKLFDLSPKEGGKVNRVTPKRSRADTAGMADVFPYYAGFRFEWARDILRERVNQDERSPVILDPWNGSGTTTTAAQFNGYRSIGVDLNPVANISASLRASVQAGTVAGESFVPAPSNAPVAAEDALSTWFSRRTAGRIRSWVKALDAEEIGVSSLGLMAIFRMVKKVTGKFEGSNPTWVKKAKDAGELIDISINEVDSLIMEEQRFIIKRLDEQSDHIRRDVPVDIITASATNLPLADSTVDSILTSPPYLTRIDYGVAYSRELAVIGINVFKNRKFRGGLMGTTLIREKMVEPAPWGPMADDLVNRITSHSSKASASYYRKQAIQYFEDLAISFDEISRVAASGATLTLVVQDSYYKDIPLKLDSVCIEEASRRGWEFEERRPEIVSRSFAHVNTLARAYPKGEVSETVVMLKKS